MKAKRWLCLAACVLTALVSQAQNLKVESFRELSSDLTANTYGTSKEDQNGEICALIKVVAPEQDFKFDGGSLGIEAVEQKAGEIWVYVPRRAQKLTINHQVFGVLRDYYYPVPIEGGKTYEMLLDIGTGVFVTVSPTVAKSKVYIDREYAGEGTVYHRYMNYGKHTLQAVNGMWEGTRDIVVTTADKNPVFDVDMQDQSVHYGEVVMTVDNEAEIWYAGQKVGTGRYTTTLREGSYTFMTRHVDCDDSETTFSVRPQQRNDVQLKAPVPFTGYLRVYTRPQNAVVTDARAKQVAIDEQLELPIGTHQFHFARKGYVPQDHEWTVRHKESIHDTVTLERISYIPKNFAFYFGLSYSLQGLSSGLTPLLGVMYKNNDLQLSYTFGMKKSDEGYLYDESWGYKGTMQWRSNTVSVKYGYQIPLLGRIAITPQLGYALHKLSCSAVEGNYDFANGAYAHGMTIGARVAFAPVQHLYLFAAPQMDVLVKKDDSYKRAADVAGFNAGGFGVQLGLLAHF
ncbi:MAG: hypothetical protein K5928_08370 [Prevotella sp.]|nr:hypothetical protein [Prevotella sp.]